MTVAKNATTAFTAAGQYSGIVPLYGKFKLVIGGTFTGTIKLLRRTKDQANIGAHTTGAAAAALVVSGGIDYVADELIDTYIMNNTTFSIGPVTDNTTTGVTATQIGGTDQKWDVGETASIWQEVAEYTTDTFAQHEEPEVGVDYILFVSAMSAATARVRISN